MNINVITPVVSGKSILNIDLYGGKISDLDSALLDINSKADVVNVWGNRPYVVPQELINTESNFKHDKFDLSLSTPLDIIKIMFSSK